LAIKEWRAILFCVRPAWEQVLQRYMPPGKEIAKKPRNWQVAGL